MRDLGKRIDFHTHSLFSDGMLLPSAAAREAEIKGHLALAITDHVDSSNLEAVIFALTKFVHEQGETLPIKVIAGVEISYFVPELIPKYAQKARELGVKLIVVHGESPVEPVFPGTNQVAVQLKGLVDILAHPGNICEDDVKLAAENDIYLELTARRGHRQGNNHVAALAKKYGAQLLVNSDAHNESDYITQAEAFQLAREAGLSEDEALKVIKDNPLVLLKKLEL